MKGEYEPKKLITFFNFFIELKNKVKGWLKLEQD